MSSTSTITRNVLGPLTTTFTPNPSCTVPAIDCVGPACYAWQAQTCISGIGIVDQSFCWPSWTAGASTFGAPTALNGWGFYSPGLVCPHGHSSACSSTFGGQGNFQFQFPATAGETAVGCCPSGYFCQRTNDAQTCVFTATSTAFEGATCSDYARVPTDFIIPTAITTSSDDSTTVIGISTQTLFAPLFQLNWRSVDRSSSSSSRSSPASQTQTDGATNTGDKATGGDGGGGGGLSTGAKAGIGAGVGIVALFMIGALVWFLRSKKRKGYDYGDIPMVPPVESPGPGEFYTETKGPGPRPVEVPGEGARSELPSADLNYGQGRIQNQPWELESRMPAQQVGVGR
ncbi:hypothetical protein TWF718_004700 [Orbilia javanica]|uniref:Uncharacterized protein n=1 Tax=Orbilia javanica TaxID=47235 RepID=A0AAN8N6N9_9PEZI